MVTRIQVISPNGTPAPSGPRTFYLTQDRWDDYGFKTQYHLSYIDSSSRMNHIGNVKILQTNQPTSVSSVLNQPFETLSEDFCSLGQSLDYYQRLAEMPEDDRDYILSALKDVVRDRARLSRFQSEPGWTTSVLREVVLGEFLPLASTILEQNYSELPSLDAHFGFLMSGWSSSVEFAFDAPQVPDTRTWPERTAGGPLAELPRRISVVIGRNGSGKSTLLARLARFAHASRGDRLRPKLTQLGELTPVGLGFSRVITVSYSGFDNFQVPGLTQRERRTIAAELARGTGRFIFCGLRDIGAELDSEPNQQSENADSNAALEDRQQTTILKSAQTLSAEFARIIDRIRSHQRGPLLGRALQPILADPSFNDLRATLYGQLMQGDCEQLFLGWSTGHKIVLHAICSLVAYVEKQALVLFDEPETHLHPPLLASLMHSLRKVLSEKDAYAVVATHSPVVLQETMARHVHIISREGAQTVIQRPAAETFGENIGILTSSVFNLTSEVTDFNETLRRLARQVQNLDDLEALFDTGGLSLQARAFVMSFLASAG
ncbi:energy-coupling factor transporter ATP-binding protein EcfA2 [Paraburkholderia graminis]|uniref:Energy-coupling factor transporter ATP-binding protein EcfA2 n=1 Tax=Paraburkholderia graminis TaxID=60548 RepID=A0ABD5CAD3_9BURK|nr:energy-coupling factor transporter ATP-binding protein EcfA2 [Paraburkholderia graminis]